MRNRSPRLTWAVLLGVSVALTGCGETTTTPASDTTAKGVTPAPTPTSTPKEAAKKSNKLSTIED